MLYFSPTALGFWAQLLLALFIGLYFVRQLGREVRENTQIVFLSLFWAFFLAFIALLLYEALSLAPWNLHASYLKNLFFAAALVFFLQFAYRFPTFFPERQPMARRMLVLSLVYLAAEGGFAVYRFGMLLFQRLCTARPLWLDLPLALWFIAIPIILFRQALWVDFRPLPWWRKLWRPQGQDAKAARIFGLIWAYGFLFPALNFFVGSAAFPASLYNLLFSTSLLLSIWFFANAYLNFLPGRTSFLIKLTGVTLTLQLLVLGLVGWVVTLPYISLYRPAIADFQTLRFMPLPQGGFDVTREAFHFETELGQRLVFDKQDPFAVPAIDFAFPFGAQTYPQVFVSHLGLVTFERPLVEADLQNRYGHLSAIIPLAVKLNPYTGGGIWANRRSDHLILTWYQAPSWWRSQEKYTFQLILYSSGQFDLTYNGLPVQPTFLPDDSPDAALWFRGVILTAESAPQLQTVFQAPFRIGPQGSVQDFFLDFRRYLNKLFFPLALMVAASSLFVVLLLPWLVQGALVLPLRRLLDGIEKVQAGDLDVELTSINRDEIGYLAFAFNSMINQIRNLVLLLEKRVADRTQELSQANQDLRTQMYEREVAEAKLVEDQRVLAAARERELFSRELHDGIGQVLGYFNVQSQAIQTLLQRGEVEAAQQNLSLLVAAAQDAHADVRQYILSLRSMPFGTPNLRQTIENYLKLFSDAWKIDAFLDEFSGDFSLPPQVEENLLQIVREALVNVRKHAHASQVRLRLFRQEDWLHLQITDDGVGFLLSSPAASEMPHFGLQMMKESALEVGGQAEILSNLEQGTALRFRFPYNTQPPDSLTLLSTARFLLADDHPLFANGLKNLLTARGLTVIGVAQDGFDAFEQTCQLQPDIVLMDVHMPRCDGIQATRLIKTKFPHIKIILLTVSEDENHFLDAMRYGASGYLLKNLAMEQIFDLLESVARGEAQLSPLIASRILEEFNHMRSENAPRADADSSTLTLRQWEVLRLVAQGKTYKEIGQELYLTERAIKYHMGQILERLHLENRKQAVQYIQTFQKTRKEKSEPITRPLS